MAVADPALFERLAHAVATSPTAKVAWPRMCAAFPSEWLIRKMEVVRRTGGGALLDVLLTEPVAGPPRATRLQAPLHASFVDSVFATEEPVLHRSAPRAPAGAAKPTKALIGFKLESTKSSN